MPVNDHESHRIGSRIDAIVARVLEVAGSQVGLGEDEPTTQALPGQSQVSMLRVPGHAVDPLGDWAVGIGGDEVLVGGGVPDDVVGAAQGHGHG